MVNRKNINKKYALISVYDKQELKYLCENLNKHGYGLISTGSTGKKIRELGFKCTDISKITRFKEVFDGRVKSLNSYIYSSLLFIRNNKDHIKQFKKLKIPKIDIVVVNLYPFKFFSKKQSVDMAIEMIDIGGPSLLRASSKNFAYITPITDIKDYKNLIKNLIKNSGETDIKFRRKMAIKTFKLTSEYDKLIYRWFYENKK